MGEWVKNMWCLVNKINEIMLFVIKWIEVEMILLSKINFI